MCQECQLLACVLRQEEHLLDDGYELQRGRCQQALRVALVIDERWEPDCVQCGLEAGDRHERVWFDGPDTQDEQLPEYEEALNGWKPKVKTPLKRFHDWRTYHLSDHLPMWIEIDTDFSRGYLATRKRG